MTPTKAAGGKTDGKDIGLGLAGPKEACQDPKCAWHGNIPVRGRVFEATVKSVKARNTATVEWGYHRFINKYERFEKRKSRVTAHNPPCMKAREGDAVVIAECRPLSKTKHFIIVSVKKSEKVSK
jgi:small subunit ribosomal protein S17